MSEYLENVAITAYDLSKRATRILQENTLELSYEGSAKYLDGPEEKLTDLRKVLENSSTDREKAEVMKKLLAIMSKGKDAISLFSSVVKLVSTKSFELRRLVYLYLLRYAEREPELALLSVNSFQKDLSDDSPLIRSMALRVLSGIRIKVICSIVLMAIQKCSSDVSVYVRKAAALAVLKCYQLDHSQHENLIPILKKLLNDRSPFVVGCAITAFNEIGEDNDILIHPLYKSLCSRLLDMDEWGQCESLLLLTRYARKQFLKPSVQPFNETQPLQDNLTEFYSEAPQVQSSKRCDTDHELLLNSAIQLLHSKNSSVVLSAASLLYHTGTVEQIALLVKPLTRPQRYSVFQDLYLKFISIISKEYPNYFKERIRFFFWQEGEGLSAARLKLEILVNLSDEQSVGHIMKELQHYLWYEDERYAIVAVKSIGGLVKQIPIIAELCINGLSLLLQCGRDGVIKEAVKQMHLICLSRSDLMGIILPRLVQVFAELEGSSARAGILEIASFTLSQMDSPISDLIRLVLRTYPTEHEQVRLATLSTAGRFFAAKPMDRHARLLLQQVMEFATFDPSYDIRDRLRLWRSVSEAWGLRPESDLLEAIPNLSNFPLAAGIKELLHLTRAEGNKHIGIFSPVNAYSRLKLEEYISPITSLSFVLGEKLVGWKELPDWPSVKPNTAEFRNPSNIFTKNMMSFESRVEKEDNIGPTDDLNYFYHDVESTNDSESSSVESNLHPRRKDTSSTSEDGSDDEETSSQDEATGFLTDQSNVWSDGSG